MSSAHQEDKQSRFDAELVHEQAPERSPAAPNPAMQHWLSAQRSEAWGSSPETSRARASVAGSAANLTSSLDPAVAHHVAARSGVDVSSARIHTGPSADATTAGHAARAVTVGSDIFLGAGERVTDNSLLAHEATHVAQQASNPALAGTPQAKGSDNLVCESKDEYDANAAGQSVPGATTGDKTTAPGQGASKEGHVGAGYALSEAEGFIGTTRRLMTETETVLLSAYRKAVDSVDAAGAMQLAQACVKGIKAANEGYKRASTRSLEADPYARLASTPENPGGAVTPVGPDEPAQYAKLKADVELLRTDLRKLEHKLLIHMGPMVFRGIAVIGRTDIAPPNNDAVQGIIREASIVVDVLITVLQVKAIVGNDPNSISDDNKRKAVSIVEKWRGRPLNFFFMRQVLMAEGLWAALADTKGESGKKLRKTHSAVQDQARETGSFDDVGEWDADKVEEALTYGGTDWAITDEDAQKVYKMIVGAAPMARAKLVHQLDEMGRLGRFCENLPWRWVKELHDAISDKEAKAKLRKYFEGKGGGKSLSKEYEGQIMQHLQKENYVRAYLWTFLDTAHSGLTFGFKDVHDAAYDASEEGWISDDAYFSTAGKALARSVAIMAATMVTGGAAGAYGEGAALGLGASKTTASIIGGAVGGATSGVAGQLTADVFDQAFLGKEGFSSLGDYGTAAAVGGVTGALTSGVQAAGSKYLPNSAKSMSQVYAEKYPHLDNVLTRIRNSGARTGMKMRVTGQELAGLAKSGLISKANIDASLDRIGAVWNNERIDVSQKNLSRVHPQSEVEAWYGDVDPVTGKVRIRNQDPSSAGYAGETDRIPAAARTSDQAMRDSLGIDGPINWYDKYKNPSDPLFEVVFKTSAELDVPLPSDIKSATGHGTLGAMDPQSHHMSGTGVTKGGVPEGVMPRGTAIEIVDIRPVGNPRASYPSTGATYNPYSTPPASVRNLAGPTAGAVSGTTGQYGGQCRDDD